MVLSAALLLSVACGSSTPAPVVVSNNVSVVIVNGVGATDLPFDPREARITAATEQLTAIAGHPITFQFDVALLPDWRVGFEEALVETLEHVARDLKLLQKDNASAFAFGVPKLDRIVCRYSAITQDEGNRYGAYWGQGERKIAVFDADGRAVTLTSRAEGSLVPRASVAGAIERAFEDATAARYANAEPESVPPGERAAYFAFIDRGAHKEDRPLPGEPRSPTDVVWIPRVVRLSALVGPSDPVLAASARKWLFGKMDDFSSAYLNDPALVAHQAPGSRWKNAEAAYLGWMNAVAPSMNDAESATVVRYAYVPMYNSNGHFGHDGFPGFDLFLFGLRVADGWRSAGHPTKDVLPRERADVFGSTLCIDNLGRADRCTWLKFASETDGDMSRLATALITRKDDVLTRAAVRGMPKESRMDLLHRLEPDEATFASGMGALTTTEPTEDMVPDLRRFWRAHPSAHGSILYILTILDRYEDPDSNHGKDSKVGWNDFSQAFSGGASKADIASYFAQGGPEGQRDEVVPGSRLLFPARASHFSFVDLLVAHLDAWFDGAHQRDHNGNIRFDGVLAQICHDHDEAGMQQLRDYFARRAPSHPGDYLNSTMDTWPKGHCSK